MTTALRSAHVRSLRCQKPPRTRAWPSRALARRLGRTSLISSDALDDHLDVTRRHTGVSRKRENARSDLAGAGTDLLMTREVRVDAGNVCDRSRIRRARADARPPQPREQARTVRPVPRQDGEAQVDGAGPVDRTRNLDPFDALDSRAQLVGVISSNLVVRVEAGGYAVSLPRRVAGT